MKLFRVRLVASPRSVIMHCWLYYQGDASKAKSTSGGILTDRGNKTGPIW